MAAGNTVVSNTASLTSPVCLEGASVFNDMVSVSCISNGVLTNFPASAGPDNRWFANVPLSATGAVSMTVNFEGGAYVRTQQVTWTPCDILSLNGTTNVIRAGDSLLFTAQPAGGATGSLVVTVGTNQMTTGASQPQPWLFNQPGTFTVTGTVNDQNGNPQTGSLAVKVVGYQFPENPICEVGQQRIWNLTNVPPEVVFDHDSHLGMIQTGILTNNGRQLNLEVDGIVPRVILSRLGNGGPVLSSATANGFEMFVDGQTYDNLIQTYPDGTRLVQTMLVVWPLAPGVTVEVHIFVAGVTFDDGTTTKWLTAANFDSQGRCLVNFLWPASSHTSVCHTITVWQGNNVVWSD